MKNIVQRVGNLIHGTPLYPVAVAIYSNIEEIFEHTNIERVLDYWYIGRKGPLVQVAPNGYEFQPYLLRLEPAGKLQRRRARGVYESHVMSFLDEELTSDSVFWEIGAAWGYFSVAAATRVKRVYSFEMNANRVNHLEESIAANELTNITTVNDKLGSETDFTEYPAPDVVIIDIEGWEYTVLSAALEQCPDVSTWVVEVHSNLINVETDDSVNKIEELFENYEYETSTLNEWSNKNNHVVARQKTDQK